MNLKTTLKIFAIGILVVLIALLSVDIFNGSFSFEEKNKLDNLVDAKEIELTQIYNENQNLKDEIETIINEPTTSLQIKNDQNSFAEVKNDLIKSQFELNNKVKKQAQAIPSCAVLTRRLVPL